MKKDWVSLEEASAWACEQGVTSSTDWRNRCKDQGWRPTNIPKNPWEVYRQAFYDAGGWGGFLRTGAVANTNRHFVTIGEASAWAQEQGVTSVSDWLNRCKIQGWRPANIPSNPWKRYGQAFKDLGGWGGFLKTGTVGPKNYQFMALEDASIWAQEQGLTTQADWQNRCQIEGWRPSNIPSSPWNIYGQAFIDAGGWAGFINLKKYSGFSKIERMMRHVLDDCFEQKAILGPVKAQGASGKRWSVDMAYEASHLIIEYDGSHWHKTPEVLARDIGKTQDLTATTPSWHVIRLRGKPLKLIQPDLDLSLDETKRSEHQIEALLHHLHRLHDQKRIDLSSRVLERMKLWTSEHLKNYNFRLVLDRYDGFLPLEEASAWAQEQGVTSSTDWANRCKDEGWRPTNIPSSPPNAYGQAFTDAGGWGGFLNTGYIAHQNRHFVTLVEASAWAKKEGVTGQPDWINRCKDEGWRPANIPSNPEQKYGQEFYDAGGWGGFVGTGAVAHKNRRFATFAEASAWAQEQGVTSMSDWKNRCKNKGWLPVDIPSHPEAKYAQEFKAAGGWGEFLNTGAIAPKNYQFMTLKDASIWAQEQGVTTQADWKNRCKDEGWRPTNIPSDPYKTYGQAFKDAGGWGVFLRGKPIGVSAPVEETHQSIAVSDSDKVLSIPKLGSLNFDRLNVSDRSTDDRIIPLRRVLGKNTN